MANIFLDPNETFGPLGDQQTVFGSTGNETVLVQEGGNFTIDATTERVELPGSVSDFTFQTVGTSVEIRNANTGDLVATFNDLSNSPQVVFGNGATTLTAPSTVGGPAQLGGTDIPTDSASSVTPGSIDTSVTSRTADPDVISGTVNGELFSPADSADVQTSGADEEIKAFGGNDTIDGGGGTDTIDGGEGFDHFQIGNVSGQTFGTDGDDVSLEQLVTNIQLIDTRQSGGGNTFDLTNNLINESITGGQNPYNVVENSFTFFVGSADDEIDLGDVSPSNIETIRVISEAGTDTSALDIVNPNGVDVVNLTSGNNAILNGGDFTVPGRESFYIGTDSNETVTAQFSNLDGNDTIAGAEGDNTLALTGSFSGSIPLNRVEYVSGFNTLNLTGVSGGGLIAGSSNLVLNNELVGQLVSGLPNADIAENLTVTTGNSQRITIDTQDVSKDDTIVVEGGDFVLANQRSGPTTLQGNIVTISDDGAGIIFGSNGNDSINGGDEGDVITLDPARPPSRSPSISSSGDNVVSGGGGNDNITAGTGQDNLTGDQGNDTFNFGLNSSGASRLNSKDTVAGGEGTQDTVNLVPNTVLASQSEVQNVTGIEIINLNGDGTATSTPVANEFTLIDNLVDTTTDGTTLTIDATNNFSLAGSGATGNQTSTSGESIDQNLIKLNNLSADSQVNVQGGNASERLVFSDASFNGLSTLEGGQGGIDSSFVGLPLPFANGTFQFTPDLTAGFPVSNEGDRIDLANSVSNIDTLDFRADGGNTFTADSTDFENVTGFEEIQLTNSQGSATASNFNITLTDEIVRNLTQPSATNAPTNVFISLDSIEQIGGTNIGQQIAGSSNVTIDASNLTNTLNTVTVLDPNGVNPTVIPPGPGLSTRVQTVPADIITSAELNRGAITNNYATGPVRVTVGNNLRVNPNTGNSIPAVLSFQGGVSETITTGDGDFNINTGGGADSITTGTGNDNLAGQGGNDIFFIAAGGTDTVNGGLGSDTVSYQNVTLANTDPGFTVDLSQSNFISIENVTGSDGQDTITGDSNDNSLNGAAGADTISGLQGNDTLNGDTGNDSLSGENGNDTLDGGRGDDDLFGGFGNDTLDGGRNQDTLEGDAGNDTLDGGRNQDTLEGDAGNDVFVLADDFANNDTINDFVSPDDNIAIDDAGLMTAPNALVTVTGATFTFGVNPNRTAATMGSSSLTVSQFATNSLAARAWLTSALNNLTMTQAGGMDTATVSIGLGGMVSQITFSLMVSDSMDGVSPSASLATFDLGVIGLNGAGDLALFRLNNATADTLSLMDGAAIGTTLNGTLTITQQTIASLGVGSGTPAASDIFLF